MSFDDGFLRFGWNMLEALERLLFSQYDLEINRTY